MDILSVDISVALDYCFLVLSLITIILAIVSIIKTIKLFPDNNSSEEDKK